MATDLFVEQLYTNFLGRSSDAVGKAYWTEQIDNGILNAAQVTQQFINSAEFSGVVSPIAQLYYAAFNRIPDASGLSYWVQQAQSGQAIHQIANAFVNSSEFLGLAGQNADNNVFLDNLYQNTFNRAADDEGKAYWLNEMSNKGLSQADVLVGFADSQELNEAKGENIKVIVKYHGITATTPSQNDIDTAISNANPVELITQLYASASYIGEAVPGLNKSGVVLDGYIRDATVFIDLDGDGVLDSNEISTTTDAFGNFSFAGNETFAGTLVMQGGTDIATGKAFEGSYTAPSGSSILNPLTTLIQKVATAANISPGEAETQVSTQLNLASSIDLLNYDPVKISATETASSTTDIALQVQATAVQINTMVNLTAALLTGTGIVANETTGGTAAFTALANLLADTSAEPFDLTSISTVEQIIENAANSAGADSSQQTTLAALSGDAATTISNLTNAINDTIVDSTNPMATLTEITQIQIVAKDIENATESGASTGDISATVSSTTGTTLIQAVRDASAELGDVDGDGTSEAPPPPPPPATSFTVSIETNVVTFGGTARGDISYTLAGQVATFSRAGITATTTVDFSAVPDTITLTGSQVIEDTLADLAVAGLNTINGSVTASDSGSVTAATLNTVDSRVTGTLTATAATALSGTAADANTAYASGNIAGLGNEAVTLSDTSLAASALNTLNGKTTGTIDASTVTALTSSTVAAVKNLIASAGITTAANYAVTLSDATVSIADANTVDGDTTGVVTATLVTESATNLATLTGTDNAYTLTTSGTGASAAELNTLDAATTINVTATSITGITGTAADTNLVYGGGFIGLGDEAITLSDTTLVASVLNTLDGNTTGAINATTVTTLTGTAADANTAYASGGITGLADEAITLSDTTLVASVLNTLDGNTTGAITTSGGSLDVTGLNGLTIAATNATDTFVFTTSDVGVAISDFTLGTDKINIDALTADASSTVWADLTPTDAKVYFYANGGAGNADSTGAAATALSAAQIIGDSTALSYIFVTDDDSSALYQWQDAGSDEVVAGELTLMATVDAVLTTGDLLFI